MCVPVCLSMGSGAGLGWSVAAGPPDGGCLRPVSSSHLGLSPHWPYLPSHDQRKSRGTPP